MHVLRERAREREREREMYVYVYIYIYIYIHVLTHVWLCTHSDYRLPPFSAACKPVAVPGLGCSIIRL